MYFQDDKEYRKLVELIKSELKNIKNNGYISSITIKNGKGKFRYKNLKNHS